MMQDHTAMAAALRAAGYLDAEARLLAAAVDAWAKHPAPAAADHRRAHVTKALGDEGCYRMIRRHNADALARLEATAANELLADAREMIAAQRPKDPAKAGGGGQIQAETHKLDASASTDPEKPAQAGESVGGHFGGETHKQAAPDARPTQPRNPRATRPASPDLAEMAARQRAAMAARFEARSNSILRQITVQGRPIGECTPAEIRPAAERNERHGRFMRLLIAGVPDTMRVDRAHTPQEAEAMWLRSAEAIAA